MTELDHIIAIHRWEQRRADAAFDLVFIGLAVIAYAVYRLIGWLA